MLINKVNLPIIGALLTSFLVTLICVLTGNYAEDSLDVQIGKVSPAKIVAPRQIENTFATEKRRQEAAASVTPLFKIDNEVAKTVNNEITRFFVDLEKRKAIEDAQQASAAPEPGGEPASSENSAQQDGNPASADNPSQPGGSASVKATSKPGQAPDVIPSPIIITDEQFNTFKSQNRATRLELRDTLITIADSILEHGIKDETDTKSLLYIREELNKKPWPMDLRNMGYSVVAAMLKPNLIEDKEATTTATEAKVAEINPVMILQGQKIVDESEIITEEIYSVLKSFDMVKDNPQRSAFTPLGASALIALIFAVFIFYARVYYKKFINSCKLTILLTLLFSFTMIMVRFMCGITFYIIPITIPCILVAILIDERLAVFLNFLIIFLAALIYKGSFEFILYFALSGSTALLLSKYTFERTNLIIVGIFVSLANLLLITAVNLFFYKSVAPELMFNSLIAMTNGLLSLLVAIGSLPIWEAAFDILTPIKLLDLTKPNNYLLRKLTIEAPGTYHHSLIVANLAEQAAFDIEANAPLARVGGYYHDIGKLKYPYYFGENQAGNNAHENLDPYDSAQLIMQHVPVGMELADHYKLPKAIKDIIGQHHGTTLVKFFYHKAKELYSEQQIKENDFRYKCLVPKSKEAAVVMLADTAEAAVRSMVSSSKSMNEVEEFLSVLIKDKLDDSQLDDSFLTISDLVIIRKSFMKVFKGMYHERVKYPSPIINKLEVEDNS